MKINQDDEDGPDHFMPDIDTSMDVSESRDSIESSECAGPHASLGEPVLGLPRRIDCTICSVLLSNVLASHTFHYLKSLGNELLMAETGEEAAGLSCSEDGSDQHSENMKSHAVHCCQHQNTP